MYTYKGVSYEIEQQTKFISENTVLMLVTIYNIYNVLTLPANI